MDLDRLILGSNPLYGVDHFSAERARERFLRLDSEKIVDVLKASFSAGATGFNFSPHPIIFEVLARLKEEGYSHQIGLYPMLPDTQTYVTTQLNSGTTGMIKRLLGDLGFAAGTHALIKGGLSLLTSDPMRVMKLYLDVETKRLTDTAPANFKLRVVIAHEIISDMALALKSKEILRTYVEYLHDKYNVQAGFVTRNFHRFVEFCEQSDMPLDDIVLMTPFNKIGFQMAPSRQASEQTLSKLTNANVIAMSVLAGGQIDLEASVEYLKSLTNLSSVALGVSTEEHARESFPRLARIFGRRTSN